LHFLLVPISGFEKLTGFIKEKNRLLCINPMKTLPSACLALALCLPATLVNADVAPDHFLMGMGICSHGQLGVSGTDNAYFPVEVAEHVTAVAAGSAHAAFLTENGELFVMGSNNYGQLGDGTRFERTAPEQIAAGIASVATGTFHTLYITSTGDLYSVGYNEKGQLGVDLGKTPADDVIVTTDMPHLVTTGVKAAAGGSSHSLYLTTTGDLYSMGSNSCGQLGYGTHDYNTHYTPQIVCSGVKEIAAGNMHSLYVTTSGDLYAMGSNTYGQLGDGTTTDRATPVLIASDVAAVAAGYDHSLFIKTNGDLYAMGINLYGQLGDGTKANRATPVRIATNVAAISADYDQSLYVTTSGDLYTVGLNFYGQLGIGKTAEYSVPTPVLVAGGVSAVAAGNGFSLYLTSDCSSAYWPSGELGAKWDATMGWIDDTYFPWVYSYTGSNWYYLYDALKAEPARNGYWTAYYTPDFSDYGWGYIWPGYGWYCFASDMSWQWLGIGEGLPQ
jgi:alpha-tubulin suppressor-like RCC1 family protein